MVENKKKKISVVGIVGLPANYGGFETLTEQMVTYLGDDYNFRVFCSSTAYLDQQKTFLSANLEYIPLSANGVRSILYDTWGLLKCLRGKQVVLLLGVSAGLFLPVFRLLSRNRLVVNIDGLEWRREKWGKFARWFLKISEWAAVRMAHEIVTDNEVIHEYIKNEYDRESHLIEYGGDHAKNSPKELPARAYDALPNTVPFDENYAMTVCRIEPENNVGLILEAFCNESLMPLVFIGNWQASEYGQDLLRKYGKCPNIHMVNPIFDIEIINWLRANCSAYLHGHSAGGTNPSLVEAMWAGAPVLSYDVNFNRVTTENKSAYFSTPEEIMTIIKSHSSERIEQLKKDLSEIAGRRYTWKRICSLYQTIFQQCN